MRLVLFLNNWGGWQVGKWLREGQEEIVGLVIQPENDQRFAAEILQELKLPPDRVWLGPDLRNPATLRALRALQPDIGVSAWFAYILKPELLEIFPRGCVNLHSAYLPWNRGWHTNVWPILDGSPAGVTVHYIDAGVDTGDLITQRLYSVEPTDTGGSMHQKLNTGMVELFKDTWPSLRAGTAPRTPQDHSKMTRHRRGDLAAIDGIEMDKTYVGIELFNLFRARTYPPYPAAYFMEGQRRVYVRVQFSTDGPFADSSAAEAEAATPINLGGKYTAGEFLKLLGAGQARGGQARFNHGSRHVFVRAVLLSEEELNPSGTPSWMGKPDKKN